VWEREGKEVEASEVGERNEGEGRDREPKLLLNQGPSEPCYTTVCNLRSTGTPLFGLRGAVPLYFLVKNLQLPAVNMGDLWRLNYYKNCYRPGL